MGKMSRDKGARREREIVELHRRIGVNAERIPLSGAAGGSFAGDITIPGLGVAEVKARASGEGFKTIEGWLGKNAALFLKRDRAEPLVVLPWSSYALLLNWSPNAGAGPMISATTGGGE